MKLATVLFLLATSSVSASAHPFQQRPSAAALMTLRGGGALGKITKKLPKPLRVSKREKALEVSGGDASIPSEVFNLVKAIVGVGVLSLPAGIANFGNGPSAVAPAVGLIAIIGLLSAYGFSIIGRVCAYTGAASYGDAWSCSVGESSGWVPTWSATLMTSSACLAYSMVLADTFCSLFGTEKRTQVLLTLTGAILLPLCWMKNLSSLAPFSLLGVCGMAYTGLAMAFRYFDGSYGTEGALLESVPEAMRPVFGTDGWKSVLQPSSLILVCMLSTAYMAHFNAPKFYQELHDNTLPRFNTVVGTSFGISIVLMAGIAAVGFLTFGSSCSGLVLNNYSSKDVLMGASRIAVAVSLVFSYPLAFQGCRDGILDVFQVSDEKKKQNSFLNLTTVVLLAGITFLAANLKDVSFVLAFGGATLGNALTYVYPAIMYWSVVRKQKREGETLGVWFASFSAILGLAMGAIGAKMALEN